MKYRVVYTRTIAEEYTVDVASVDEAQKDFEAQCIDAELFFIEDENGHCVFFD